MFVQNAVATCVCFGYSMCVCVLWTSLLEDSFDGGGLLRTGSSNYRTVLEFIYISFSLFGYFNISVFNHRSIITIISKTPCFTF